MTDLHLVNAGQSAGTAKPILRVETEDGSMVVPDMPIFYASGLPSNQTERQRMQMPFARSAVLGIVDDQIIYGMGDSFEYLVFSRDGSPRHRVRANFEPIPVTTALWNAEREANASRWGDRDAYSAVGRTIDRVRHRPPTLPAYTAILGEEDGRIWVRRNSGDPKGEQLWACFDRSGSLLGKLVLPAAYTVVRFSNGHAVVRHKDDQNGFTAISAFRIVTSG